MPLQTSIAIGAYRFDLHPKEGHTVQDVDLGPSGEVDFTMDDWAQGLNAADEGVNYVKGKYTSGTGVDAAFPKQLILQPQATTISVASGQPALGAAFKQVDFTGGGTTNTYLIQAGTTVHALNGSQQWTAVASLNGNNATDAVTHGGNIIVAFSFGHKYTATGSGAWTSVPSTVTDRVGVLGQNIWRADRPNELYSASAINGTWSSAYTVSDSQFAINSLTGLEQVLMIGKEDGIYTIDQEGVVTPFTPELRPQYDTNFASVSAAVTFNGDYYFRTLHGLIMISGQDGQKRRVGLDNLASPDIPTPNVTALCSDDRYLYALCDNAGADLTIMRMNIRGQWHVFYSDRSAGTKQGQHIAISSALGYPALFFSYYDGSSAYTAKYIRTSEFPNPLQDTSYRYDTSATLRLRLGRFAAPEAPVVFDRCIIQSRQLGASITVIPYYSVDGGAITQFGSSAATTSPLTTIHPGTPPSGHLWDLYVEMLTNDNTTTPVLTGISFKGRHRPSRRRMHTFVIQGEAEMTTRSGGHLRRSVDNVIADLNSVRDTNTYLSCTDENNRQFSALVESIQRVHADTGTRTGESGAVFRVVLAESAAALAAATWTYGSAVYG